MARPVALRLLVLNWAKQSQWLIGLGIIDTDRYLASKQLIQKVGDELLSPSLQECHILLCNLVRQTEAKSDEIPKVLTGPNDGGRDFFLAADAPQSGLEKLHQKAQRGAGRPLISWPRPS